MKCSLWLVLTIVLLMPLCVGVAAPSNVDNGLTQTEWRLTSFGPRDAPATVIEGSLTTIKFGADGRVGGNGGCNSYGGNYQLRDDSLSLSRIISTKRACVDQRAMEQEQRFLGALESVRTFSLKDDRLTIFYDGGRSALHFVKASTQSSAEQQQPYENLKSPVELLASYYNAVNSREYERAYRYWETSPGKIEDFARGFAATATVQLIVQPPTRLEGAAGSLYAEVPTVIVARHRDGSDHVFAGCYVTRKSNSSPADIPKEEVWRIYKASVLPVTGAVIIPKLLAQACRK